MATTKEDSAASESVISGDNGTVFGGDNRPVANGDDRPVVGVVCGDERPVVCRDDRPIVHGDSRPIVRGDNRPVVGGDDRPIILAKELENPPFARSLLLLVIAKSFKTRQTSIHHDRQALFQSAINDLRESIEVDPYDSISHFHLAHNLSFINQTQEALKSIERCLLLSPADKYSLHLYALLLTAQKQMSEAYAQIYRATNDYPDISRKLYLKEK
ncbi:unnamed protein product [Rotaria sp. Silwood1]|nr:unnamed protein product [Rotaria sp. Silwood1]CAF1677924.1 unnamed protein product [Rotaria sp. Silwood1]